MSALVTSDFASWTDFGMERTLLVESIGLLAVAPANPVDKCETAKTEDCPRIMTESLETVIQALVEARERPGGRQQTHVQDRSRAHPVVVGVA